MIEPKETIKAVGVLFPDLRANDFCMRPREISDLPFWLKAAVNIFTLEIRNREPFELTLIQPKAQLSFDQIQNIYAKISEKTGPNTLLIADNINPRNRPLLVKFRIPFVYKNETVFAPELGFIFKNLRAFDAQATLRAIPFKDELHPFSLKLISGYLTGFVAKEFQLKPLYEDIVQRGGSPSTAKLSGILKELVEFELVRTESSGPQKRFIFEERQSVWNTLQTLNLGHFMRTMRVYFVPGQEHDYVLAGESALSQHSELMEPQTITTAIALADYNSLSKDTKKRYLTNTGEAGAVIQLWKENPKLYSSYEQKTINPIELYFSMRDQRDERIQIALEQMLMKLGLAPLNRG